MTYWCPKFLGLVFWSLGGIFCFWEKLRNGNRTFIPAVLIKRLFQLLFKKFYLLSIQLSLNEKKLTRMSGKRSLNKSTLKVVFTIENKKPDMVIVHSHFQPVTQLFLLFFA